MKPILREDLEYMNLLRRITVSGETLTPQGLDILAGALVRIALDRRGIISGVDGAQGSDSVGEEAA